MTAEKKQTPAPRGLIQSYTGPGRGKSSAGAGLALRARGAGMKVLLVRFLKSNSSEDACLEKLGVKITTVASSYNFANSSNTSKIKNEIKKTFDGLKKGTGDTDLLILDEILTAVKKKFFKEGDLLQFLSGKRDSLEVILTGRGITKKIIEISDLVSQIREVKHPFTSGIKARYGFDR